MVKRHSGIKYFMQCQEISTTLNFQIKYLSDRAPSGNFILNLNKKGFLALKNIYLSVVVMVKLKSFRVSAKNLVTLNVGFLYLWPAMLLAVSLNFSCAAHLKV